jgi:hypothetical protein
MLVLQWCGCRPAPQTQQPATIMTSSPSALAAAACVGPGSQPATVRPGCSSSGLGWGAMLNASQAAAASAPLPLKTTLLQEQSQQYGVSATCPHQPLASGCRLPSLLYFPVPPAHVLPASHGLPAVPSNLHLPSSHQLSPSSLSTHTHSTLLLTPPPPPPPTPPPPPGGGGGGPVL